MPLRITVELIPGGDETRAEIIGRMDVTNVKMTKGGRIADYHVRMVSVGGYTHSIDGDFVLKRFRRSDGFWRLIGSAIIEWMYSEEKVRQKPS